MASPYPRLVLRATVDVSRGIRRGELAHMRSQTTGRERWGLALQAASRGSSCRVAIVGLLPAGLAPKAARPGDLLAPRARQDRRGRPLAWRLGPAAPGDLVVAVLTRRGLLFHGGGLQNVEHAT